MVKAVYAIAVLRTRPREEVYSLRAFLASCEAAFVCLPWSFRSDSMLRVEIPGLPGRVLFEVQHRHSEVLFPPVWLWCRALL